MRYFVISDDGQKSGPDDIPTLNSWITAGKITAATLLEEEESGVRVVAGRVAGFRFVGSTGPPPVVGPQSPSSHQQHGIVAGQAAGPCGYRQYATSPPETDQSIRDKGSAETNISWAMGAFALICCGCGWLFSAFGIVMAVIGIIKGNRHGLAALFFNLVVTGITLYASLRIFEDLHNSDRLTIPLR